MRVYLDRNFLLTYAASFISLFGSKLLMISYVAFVYGETGSATLASAVFAADWVANLFVGLFTTHYIDRADARRLLLRLNLAAAAVTLLFLACLSPDQFPVAVAVIFVRALLNSAVNAARVKALVQFFDKRQTDLYSAVLNSSLFIAIAVAGAAGTVILRFVGMSTVVLIDVATFLVSAALFALVRPNRARIEEARRAAGDVREGVAAHVRSAARIIVRTPVVSTAVFYIVLTVTAFQATYLVLITAVPDLWFSLGEPGTAMFFTAESLAVIAGLFLYQYLSRRELVPETRQRRLNAAVTGFAVCMYAALPAARSSLVLALAAFVAMVLAVEMVWAHQYKRLIAHTPEAKVSAVVGLLSALGYSLMAVFGFVFSWVMDTLGAEWAVTLDLVLIALLVTGWEARAHRLGSRHAKSIRPARTRQPRGTGGQGGEGPRPDGRGRGAEPAAAAGPVRRS
ncbi:MFS transporter [Streptomyces sp. NPDC002867]|uniref:MFS transporter n=1 Tax=Streptomyces sp. PKU-EA00015 TaxID=2748326 RepID=UPI0015A23CDC|nr:MFS transporter [Streptomyces sp. PKU-EA00015]NWF29376.1 MFS transporter [Streptomyces sp. PKU-EA00015]